MSVAHRLVILYEDDQGLSQRFPLHDLVVKSAADLCRIEVWELQKRVIKAPKNGNNKVLDEVRRIDRFARTGAHLVAWLDNDRIRSALQLEPRCARQTVIAAIKGLVPAPYDRLCPGPLEVFLLDDNLEDLLSSVGRPAPASQSSSCRIIWAKLGATNRTFW